MLAMENYSYEHYHKGYIHNCTIKRKDSDEGPLFEIVNDHVIARLDGYAIIPMEEYRRLTKYELEA